MVKLRDGLKVHDGLVAETTFKGMPVGHSPVDRGAAEDEVDEPD